MSMAKLLEPFGGGLACDDPRRNMFDIHGGGVDLVFPHHENEIAQSCCAFGSQRMANVWMHNGFLQVEGEKMAKSLGNFVTIRELLDTGKFGNSTWPGDVLRLAMLRTHYRQPIDWTVRELNRAYDDLKEWYDLVNLGSLSDRVVDRLVLEALCDDLNTHGALVRVHELATLRNCAALRASLSFLGFSCERTKLGKNVYFTPESGSMSLAGADAAMFVSRADGTYSTDPATQKRIDELIGRRIAARAAKNFAEADRIRGELSALGVTIKDNKDGTTTWEPKR
jgi:cysteinyl-tRNA synthetase